MRDKLLLFLLIASVGGSFVGAFLKISHLAGADIVLAAGLVAGLFFATFALTEIMASNVPVAEKLMWVFAFIFLNWLAVILYLAFSRKRVLITHSNNFSNE